MHEMHKKSAGKGKKVSGARIDGRAERRHNRRLRKREKRKRR